MRVLILSKDRNSSGGVVNFMNILVEALRNKIIIDRLYIGKRTKRNNIIVNLFSPFYDCLKLLYYAKKYNYDVIHLNPSLTINSILRDGFFLYILRLIRFKNVLIFWHGWNDVLYQRINKSLLFKTLFIIAFGKAKATLVLASCFRNKLINIGVPPSTIQTTTTMFDKNIFIERRSAGKHYGDRIIFISRLVKEKGVYNLLHAFEIASKKYPNLSLVIAGDGPEKRQMEKWVANHKLGDKITFSGYIRGVKKGTALLNAGLFVFPTYHGEGCPVSLLEAMAAGLAIITTPVAAIPDIIKNNVNGIILNDIKPESIANAICRFVDDICFLERVQQNNSIKAWSKYETFYVAKYIKNIYAKLSLIPKKQII